MQYIKITNVVNEVNRLKLEKLGFSTKRDDQGSIGQFGSGIKFAPIAAIRKGMEFIFAGADSKGDYVLKYVVKDEEGIPSIFYEYEDYIKPSSFTVDAGTFSWNDNFQILREVVANAMDEAKNSNTDWSVDIVSTEKIKPVPGEFSVYLSATTDMISLLENFNKYFSSDRIPIFVDEDNNVKIYYPIDDSFRTYSKNVLVYSSRQRSERYGDKEMSSIFDYQFDNILLNEERTIKSEYDMNSLIVNVIDNLEESFLIERILKKLIDRAQEEDGSQSFIYECDGISKYMFGSLQKSDLWIEVFEKLYPNHVLVKSTITINQSLTIKSRALFPLVIDHEIIYDILTKKGLPTIVSVTGTDFIYDYEMQTSLYPKLQEAMNIVEFVYPEFSLAKEFIGVFDDSIDEIQAVNGMTLNIPLNREFDEDLTKVILISKSHVNDGSVINLISTLIHEWDHYTTSIGDGCLEGRMFRSLADERLGNLVYNYYIIHKMQSELLN